MSPAKDSHPFAVQLEVEFLDRLSEPVRDGRAKSVSAIIRAALEQYDFANVVVVRPAQLLVSVRLPVGIREALQRTAREKHTSVGQLVRTAVEAYLPQVESADPSQFGMPIPYVEMPETEEAAPAPAKTGTSPARQRKSAPAARRSRKTKRASRTKPARAKARKRPKSKRRARA